VLASARAVPGYQRGVVLGGGSGEFSDTGLCSRATAVSWGSKSQNGKDLVADTLSTGCDQQRTSHTQDEYATWKGWCGEVFEGCKPHTS